MLDGGAMMSKYRTQIRDAALMTLILSVSFLSIVLMQKFYAMQTLAPMIFLLSVFLISLKTQGYFWGILASLLSVLAVNFAFTFPFFQFDFFIPENLFSALVTLCIAIMTSTLTTRIKQEERMRAESEPEKVRANFLRAISHDLRTPLTSIYGSCSAIMENYDRLKKEQTWKLLGEMKEDAEWLIRMVENLLSVTRLDGNAASVVKRPIVLEELIDAVLVKFKKRYPNQPVQVQIPDQFVSIPMDAMLIEQVLINILENAVFHAGNISLLSLRVFLSGPRAVFEISDDGCGIPRDRLNTLFSGYSGKGPAPADGNKHGMGIGLSVCATIIRAHGGDMQAESRAGKGTVMRFSLETEDVEHEQ